MSDYTPGPWKVDGGESTDGDRYVWSDRGEDLYIGSHEVCVAVIKGRRFGEGQQCTLEEIKLADARLIAAAPELLSALLETLGAMRRLRGIAFVGNRQRRTESSLLESNKADEKARAAIAKATK